MARKQIIHDVSAILVAITYDIIILVKISSVQHIAMGHILMILSLVPSAILLLSSKCRIWRKNFALRYVKYSEMMRFLLIFTFIFCSLRIEALSDSLHEWTLLIPNVIIVMIIILEDAVEAKRKLD